MLIRIGFFSLIGISIVVGFSFYVNDKPYWYRKCRNVDIFVSDATGLRRKSPVKTLGLEIGYIDQVELAGEQVLLKICITAPVKLKANTKASIKTVGFLGDKVLELKPVEMDKSSYNNPFSSRLMKIAQYSLDFIIPSVYAEENREIARKRTTLTAQSETELSDLIAKGEKLADQLTLLIRDIRGMTSQKEFKQVVVNMNKTLLHLEKMLRPESKERRIIKDSIRSMERSLRQTEEIISKVNQGKGTLGKLINDPSIYDEAKSAIKSVNLLLGKAGTLKTFVDIGAVNIYAYDGARGSFKIYIKPNEDRYYMLSASNDPRGKITRTRTEIFDTNENFSKEDKLVIEEEGILFSLMFGKYFGPLDLRIGLMENTGGIGIGYWFDDNRTIGIHAEFFRRSKHDALTTRVYARAQVFMGLYVTAGVDEFKSRKYGERSAVPYWYGAGVYFDDEDLKYLLAFK